MESYLSDAKLMGHSVSDQAIVESLESIPLQTLTNAAKKYYDEHKDDRFLMYGMHNDRFYDLSFIVDNLPLHLKINIFNKSFNFYNFFRHKDIVLLDYILSTDYIEYPHDIPMAKYFDMDICKSLISWCVSTNRINESSLNMLGEHYNFFRDIGDEDRIELKQHFWSSAVKRNSKTAFQSFPTGEYNSILILHNIFPLFDRYNALFGKERIESDGWTDEDIDVMVEFVKEHHVSPYFIAHDTRSRDFKGKEKVYKATFEVGDNYYKYKEVERTRTFVTWKIPRDIFEDREICNFFNKMKLKHGVEQ